MDSVGIGELPDAAAYGDQGSNTVANIHQRVPLKIPTLRALGLDRVVRLAPHDPEETGENAKHAKISFEKDHSATFAISAVPSGTVRGAFGRMAEASAGKDSVTGHWEMMGIVLDRAFPTFPQGFPRDLIERFESRIGRTTIGNVLASGTQIIDRLGPEHMRTGAPIVYTSADSVFQIAA